jgi:hypothetical protein
MSEIPRDGKLILILGRRGQGKTLLGYSLFTISRRPSVFISPFKPVYYHPDVTLYQSAESFYKDSSPRLKNYFTFHSDLEYYKVFCALTKCQGLNIYIDEISIWVNQWKVNPGLAWLVRYGRARDLNCIFIARRPQEVNPLIIGQSDLIISFAIQNINDLDYLQRSYGVNFPELLNLERWQFRGYGDIGALYAL